MAGRTNRTSRRIVSALAGVITACAALAAAPPQATAATTYTRSYEASKWVWNEDTQRCVHVVATGQVSFTIGGWNSYVGLYQNRKFIAPKVNVTTYNTCNKNLVAKKIAKLTVGQVVFSDTCEPGVGIGVGYPWGVSVSTTLKCGKVKAATRVTTYGSGTSFTQSNSGTTITLANEQYGPIRWVRNYSTNAVTYYRLSVPIQVNLVVYGTSTTSDSFSLTLTDSVAP
jgi:hypothetical protein